MVKKEPLLSHDRNLLLGQVFSAITIAILIVECLLMYFYNYNSPGIQLAVFGVNFLSAVFYIFVMFILRYYVLNFNMDKLRIILMTLIIFLIIQLAFSKASLPFTIYIYRLSYEPEYWMGIMESIQAAIHLVILLTYFIGGIILLFNKTDFVGGLRWMGALFVLKVISSVTALWGRNMMTDKYIATQNEGAVGQTAGDMISHLYILSNILPYIPPVLILLIFIFILEKAKQHTISWQDPL